MIYHGSKRPAQEEKGWMDEVEKTWWTVFKYGRRSQPKKQGSCRSNLQNSWQNECADLIIEPTILVITRDLEQNSTRNRIKHMQYLLWVDDSSFEQSDSSVPLWSYFL